MVGIGTLVAGINTRMLSLLDMEEAIGGVEFTAGISVVPVGSRLLPLIFDQKGTSVNTRSMLHTWGYYVTEKQTSAPLLFAHSRSFPVMYREPPPIQFNHLVLEAWASTMRSPTATPTRRGP